MHLEQYRRLHLSRALVESCESGEPMSEVLPRVAEQAGILPELLSWSRITAMDLIDALQEAAVPSGLRAGVERRTDSELKPPPRPPGHGEPAWLRRYLDDAPRRFRTSEACAVTGKSRTAVIRALKQSQRTTHVTNGPQSRWEIKQ